MIIQSLTKDENRNTDCRRKITIFHSSGQLQFSQGATALKGTKHAKVTKSPKPKYKCFFKLATEFTRSTPILFSGHPWTSTYSSKPGTIIWLKSFVWQGVNVWKRGQCIVFIYKGSLWLSLDFNSLVQVKYIRKASTQHRIFT